MLVGTRPPRAPRPTRRIARRRPRRCDAPGPAARWARARSPVEHGGAPAPRSEAQSCLRASRSTPPTRGRRPTSRRASCPPARASPARCVSTLRPSSHGRRPTGSGVERDAWQGQDARVDSSSPDARHAPAVERLCARPRAIGGLLVERRRRAGSAPRAALDLGHEPRGLRQLRVGAQRRPRRRRARDRRRRRRAPRWRRARAVEQPLDVVGVRRVAPGCARGFASSACGAGPRRARFAHVRQCARLRGVGRLRIAATRGRPARRRPSRVQLFERGDHPVDVAVDLHAAPRARELAVADRRGTCDRMTPSTFLPYIIFFAPRAVRAVHRRGPGR